MQEKRQRAGNVILTTLIVMMIPVLVLSFSLLINATKNPGSDSLYGFRFLKVEGESMEPTIRKDAYVLAYATSYEKIKEGDIITFRTSDGTLNTHRVIAVEDGYFVTKGDANASPDTNTVSETEYGYKVIFIFNHWWHYAVYFALPLIVFAAIVVFLILVFSRLIRKKAKKSEIVFASPRPEDDDVLPLGDDDILLPDLIERAQKDIWDGQVEKLLENAKKKAAKNFTAGTAKTEPAEKSVSESENAFEFEYFRPDNDVSNRHDTP